MEQPALQDLAAALQAHHPGTAAHQERVAGLADAIACELGIPEYTREGIRLAALLHDIGKLHVAPSILDKPGPLSPEEQAHVRAHVRAGYDMLKHVELPWPVAYFVHQHHERLDGSGYPRGLTGPAILRGARIIAVADTAEALLTDSPYHAGLALPDVLERLEEGRDRLFDRQAVNACVRLLRSGRFSFGPEAPEADPAAPQGRLRSVADRETAPLV